MAGLFCTQQIACTADLQVTHSNLESGAELGKIADGGQALLCNFRQGFIRPIGEVGIGVAGGTTNTATELMELAKAETVGIFNDQGVGIGNIQTGLDDGGTYKHLDVTVCHGIHHIA